jgi:hypothetical protein
VLFRCQRRRPPEQRLVLGVLLAPDGGQGSHRGNVGLDRSAYPLAHRISVARLPHRRQSAPDSSINF